MISPAEVPDRKWVTDITQYAVGDTWLYLSAIKDLCTKVIVAYQMSFRNYTSHAYHDMLPQVGAKISMSRRGNCFDNAAMESFFSHLKTEALYPYDIRNMDEAQRRIVEFIRFYNEERIQLKLKKLTPVEYRRQFTA
ncbi:transposase [Paenibacillus motobuensis]|uniref:transposase n=1 Tax=Paenibacillus motobuensis TaxID=295324 RepID=UPI0036400E8F